MNFDTFIIRARCDGVDLNGRKIIEIKTKIKVDHESNTMELKERVQCLTMMKLSGNNFYKCFFLFHYNKNSC